MQASVAETAGPGRLPSCAAEGRRHPPGGLVSHGHAAAADGFTRPPFAHPVRIHQFERQLSASSTH
jgi:hypothetical protein